MKKGSFGKVGKSLQLFNLMKSLPINGVFLWPERPAPYVTALNLNFTIKTRKTGEGNYEIRRIK